MSTVGGMDIKCQPNNDFDTPLSNPNLKKYYHHINLAARAIYKNDFLGASTQYDSAFTYKNVPFYAHIKNFILVNNKCGFYNKNDRYIRILFNKPRIDTTILFQHIPKKVFDNQNLLLINKLQGQLEPKKKDERNLAKPLREIFILDQKAHDFTNNPDPNNIQAFVKVRDSIDNAHALKFLCLYETEGFPTEENVGVFYDKHQEWSFVIQILLWHFLQTDARSQILELMEKELQNGNLHPSNYASLLDFANHNSKNWKKEYNFMNTTIFIVQEDYYRPFVYYSDSLMREVNTNRISIGLDSFHITQKQVVCEVSCGKIQDHLFIGMSQYSKVEILPYGIVKYSFEKENLDLSKYRINTEKIITECNCQDKYY
jgi:hypothetical protein